MLLKYRMFGQVEATFVIDERGRVDTTTFRIRGPSNSPIFAATVKRAIVDGVAGPALADGRPTRQRLRHLFIFAPADYVACSGVRLPRTPDVTIICPPNR